MKVLKLLPKN